MTALLVLFALLGLAIVALGTWLAIDAQQAWSSLRQGAVARRAATRREPPTPSSIGPASAAGAWTSRTGRADTSLRNIC